MSRVPHPPVRNDAAIPKKRPAFRKKPRRAPSNNSGPPIANRPLFFSPALLLTFLLSRAAPGPPTAKLPRFFFLIQCGSSSLLSTALLLNTLAQRGRWADRRFVSSSQTASIRVHLHPQHQRRCGSKPRVVAKRLPWVRQTPTPSTPTGLRPKPRSEERRVGKECAD